MARIEWTGLPEESDELELLLSVEGRDGAVRVTPQLAARTGVLLWRVPNLPSTRARLTLRYGLEGREVESSPSAEFRILRSDVAPLAAIVYRDGEWWAQERSPSPLTGLLGDPNRDRIQEERESPPCAAASAPLLVRRREQPRVPAAPFDGPPATCPRAFPPQTPLEIPARI